MNAEFTREELWLLYKTLKWRIDSLELTIRDESIAEEFRLFLRGELGRLDLIKAKIEKLTI